MRYSEVMKAHSFEEQALRQKIQAMVYAWPEWGGARLAEAEMLVGSPEVLALMRKAGWVEPVTQGKRLTLFDRSQLRAAWEKFSLHGLKYLKMEAASKPMKSPKTAVKIPNSSPIRSAA